MSDGNLRPLFRQHLPDAMWQSVETSGVGRGVPDSHYIFPDGRCGWIEFKGTETLRAGLRPEQVAWLSRYARLGGRAYVAVRRQHTGGPRRGPPVDDLYLFRGDQAQALHQYGLMGGALSALHLEGGVRRWDWAVVRSLLTM